MRVVHVVAGLAARGGGVSSTLVELCLSLRELGVESTVVSTDLAGPASASPRRGVRLDELPAGADELDLRVFPARMPRRLAYSPELARALRRLTPQADVVHIHSLFLYPQLAGYRAAWAGRVPYVVSLHGALDPYLRQRGRARKALVSALWQRQMLSRANAIHVTAGAEADLITDVAPNVPRVLVPNPVRWSEWQDLPAPEEFRRTHLDGRSGPIVLNVGRIAEKKGLDVLVRAFARVRVEFPDALLVLAGPDDEGLVAPLTALAVRAGVGDAVVFPGMLAGRDRAAALAAADVWALPSHSENFGIAVAEALAAGRATVISPAVNIAPDAGSAGATRVVDATPEAFADAIAALLRDPRERETLGARARAFARRYDRVEVAARMSDVYDDLAARARPVPFLQLVKEAAS